MFLSKDGLYNKKNYHIIFILRNHTIRNNIVSNQYIRVHSRMVIWIRKIMTYLLNVELFNKQIFHIHVYILECVCAILSFLLKMRSLTQHTNCINKNFLYFWEQLKFTKWQKTKLDKLKMHIFVHRKVNSWWKNS